MNKNENTKLLSIGCGAITGTLLLIPLTLFLTPLILMLTWNMAICALFPALPAMTYWVAFGVNLFLNIIGNKFVPKSIASILDDIRKQMREEKK